MKTSWPWMLMVGMAGVAGFALPAAAADAAPGDKEALKIELPEPCYIGTSPEYWSPTLEPEDFKAYPPIMAPKGAAIVSKDKPVTSSAAPSIGKLSMLVDGDKNYVPGSIMELPEGVQWVQVDLQSPHEIYAILLWHCYKDKWVCFDVIVQVSNDPEFKTGVTTLYNNDADNSSHLGVGMDKEYRETNKGRLMDAKGITARYVRSYTNGNCTNDMNNYIELEVFGRPVK